MRLPRRLVWISAASIALLTLGGIVGVPWVASRALHRVAQTKAWTVRIEGGRVGLRGIWFRRIELEIKRAASLHVEFGPTCIAWSSLVGARQFSVSSAVAELVGTLDDARALLSEQREGKVTHSGRAGATEFELHHAEFAWREQVGAEPRVAIRELELTRTEGHVWARVGTLSARHAGFAVELKNAAIEPMDPSSKLDEAAREPAALRASAGEILARFDSTGAQNAGPSAVVGAGAASLGSDGTVARHEPTPSRATPAASSGDVVAAARAPQQSMRVGVKSKRTTKPGATEKTEAKKEFLPLLTWLIDEVDRLRVEGSNKATHSQISVTRWLDQVARGSRFESPALRIRIIDAGQKLDLGPWPLRAERQEQQLMVELTQAAASDKSAISSELVLDEQLEHARLKFAVGPIRLPQLGISEGDFGLEAIADTRLELEARAEYQSKSGEVSVESKGRIEGLSLRQPFIARETIKHLGFAWEGAASLDSAKRQLKTDALRLTVGPVTARVHGLVELGPTHQTIDGMFEVPLAACQDLIDVLPEGLAPLLRGWRLDRTFALRLSVAFDSRRPDRAKIGFGLDNQCRVVSVPPEASPSRFMQPFALDVEDEHGAVQSTSFGPGTWGWIPLGAISPYVESAVLVCEDGRFLYHDGFDREAIQNSIRENLRTGRFARGASTVSMQLAKNLYLRRDKTISRKLQEAALTMLLEQSLDKARLLELYLNVIEFGPGIYGIGPAAKHYFDTTPNRLTLAQSFFLVSLLPNPKPSHFGADGQVHPGWMKLVHSLMRIAQKRGHFTEAELEAGLAEQLAFRVAGNPMNLPTHRILRDPGSSFDDGELELPPLDDE